jgi:hypothetical protein
MSSARRPVPGRSAAPDPAPAARPPKNGIGAWIVLASLVGLLIFAIVFMVTGWNAAEIEGGQEMTGAGYVAMTFGIVVTIALGSGLMALVFYSSRKGHD